MRRWKLVEASELLPREDPGIEEMDGGEVRPGLHWLDAPARAEQCSAVQCLL